MKFLADQDVYAGTILLLRSLGHEVMPVAQLGLKRAEDETLLQVAQGQGCIFVTRDRDFGGLVFVRGLGSGVVYLRMLPATQSAVEFQLEQVLKAHPEDELAKSFVVVEPDGYRIRRLPKH